MSRFEYLKLADVVAAEIANGALKAGDRLPPQRHFAYERKIAVSTASRVYTELLRRGLVVGEVGRGTFVSGETRRGVSTLSEPRGQRIVLVEVLIPAWPGVCWIENLRRHSFALFRHVKAEDRILLESRLEQ